MGDRYVRNVTLRTSGGVGWGGVGWGGGGVEVRNVPTPLSPASVKSNTFTNTLLAFFIHFYN